MSQSGTVWPVERCRVNPLLKSGLSSVSVVANARHPRIRNQALTIPSFFAAWTGTEAANLFLAKSAWQVVRGIQRGDHKTKAGMAGLVAHGIASAGFVSFIAQGRRSDEEFEATLLPELGSTFIAERPRSLRKGAVVPVFTGLSKVNVSRRVSYADAAGYRNSLDVYQPKSPDSSDAAPRPIVIEVHGGGWVVGNNYEQGVPLLTHLVDNGWLGFSINYRLAPKAKFPEQVIDVKRAIAWVKEHAHEYGGDPSFIAVTGGSAGGYLTAMAALTANDPEFQPGFEEVDTSIQAAVPFYGVYDIVDEAGVMVKGFHSRFMEPLVMGIKVDEDPERWTRYNPLDRIREDAPPMMMIHGTLDTLAPVEQAREFASRMRATSDHAFVYTELEGTNHAFDVFPSPRTVRAVEYVERFLSGVYHGVAK